MPNGVPWLRDGDGNVVESFTVPLRIARDIFSTKVEEYKEMKKKRTIAGNIDSICGCISNDAPHEAC